MAKVNSAFSPFTVLSSHIFGNKNNLRGPADEFKFFRLSIRSDQVKHRGAIRRRHTHPAPAGLKDDIRNHLKPKLVHVELQALFNVSNENVNRLSAQVKILPV